MKHFDRAASALPGAAAPEAGAPEAGKAVSRPELDRLEAQRRKPLPELTLTPEGGQSVNAALERQRDARARHIAARLDNAKGRAATDFALGRIKGVAKDGFERER